MCRCTDMLINESHEYNSIHIKGGGWLQFSSEDIAIHLDNDFSLQLWIASDSDQSNDSKTLISILDEDNDNQIIFGLFRNTTANNGIDVYLYGNFVETITDDNIDWSSSNFNLITISVEATGDGFDTIKIFINDNEQDFFINEGEFNLEIDNNDLIIGGRVNTSKTIASNFWTGYIDEVRLWDIALTSQEIDFHFNNPDKLITSSTDDDQTTDITEGSYEEQRLCNLVGLWRFNYNNPTFNINDESCLELNLSSGSDSSPTCYDENQVCKDINGTIYTLPGYNVEFSKIGL